MKGTIYLTIAIITEILATTMLKVSERFTVLIPSVCVVVGYLLSFYCLSLCLRTIPLSIAYAVWSGAGTVVTAFISIIVWGEVFTVVKVLGIFFIIGGVVLLNTSKSMETGTETSG